jgi:hypothetical protein
VDGIVVTAVVQKKNQEVHAMDGQENLQQRAAEVGVSMAQLAREAHVKYHRIHLGYPLLGDEERAIEAVLDRYAFRKRRFPNAAAV